MTLLKRYLLPTATLMLSLAASAAPEPKASSVDPSMLPMLMISYAYGLANGMENGSGSIVAGTTLARIYRSLEDGLDQLHADIPTKLAFVREVYVVQPEVIGSRIVGQHGRSTLYVTGPLHDVDNASVVIISSVSPETTTIFLIDNELHAKLIYDSVVANHFAKGESCDPLGQINGIEVSRRGGLSLREANARWSSEHKRALALELVGTAPAVRCSLH